ncbi:MAG: response regulator [Parcubacteria group bacterium CG1_02_37_51]|uniref:Response regulator n=1 Tax=Candidatus Komeilibacteria bacterium CG_4_10_14_0_8_um_filter_37_78 TaxID=1974471 RepID=A0A2M7RBS0_9BACT|nr:MAG: response regulator [Parcubacteria group bacterium CG1_02_37_51]PIY93776.1 MAG: response regulator [Candidatus Komeilibacteria bacterium CG_4_10_14_0_8_um_filter_37_78]
MGTGKVTILLIEDDSFLLQMYATKLEVEGFEVVSALDGKKGLQLLNKNKPDLILLDLLMPEMNGFEVLQKIKEDQEAKDIPVIILTNLGNREDVQRCLKLGATDYLIKAHFVPAEVIKKIRQIIG